MSAIVIAMRNGACSAPVPEPDKNIANAKNATVVAHFDIANPCSRPSQARTRKNRATYCLTDDPARVGARVTLVLDPAKCPPVHQGNRPHDVAFPFSWRLLQSGWKLLFFTPGPFQPASGRSAAYNRGAYLVTALAHCRECHTSRNFFGAVRTGPRLSGTADGPGGQLVPNITPDPGTGIGKWEKDDVVELLKTGTTPEQSSVKGAMREAIQDGLKKSERCRPRGNATPAPAHRVRVVRPPIGAAVVC
jgi:mono/diheme cytochrome c family protein